MHKNIFPVGAILLQGNDLSESDRWIVCNGQELLKADYSELFNVIENIYGGDSKKGTFKVPDYRGEFLRGDKAESNTSHPGVREGCSTTRPKTASFKATIPHLPVDDKETHGITKPDNIGFDDSKKTTNQDTCNQGGDKETRPINVYVNYYIKARS